MHQIQYRHSGYKYSICNRYLGSFVPTDIGGCVLWLKADTGVTYDEEFYVSSWADQSGQGNNATQAEGGKQFMYYADPGEGYPCIRFFTTQGMNLASTIALSNFSVFIVGKVDVGAGAGGAILSNSDGGDAMMFQTVGYEWDFNINGGAGAGWDCVMTSMSIVFASKAIGSVFSSGRHNNTIFSDFEGEETGGFTIARLGRQAEGYTLKGYIAEIIAYNSKLNDTNVSAVFNYLNARYSVY